MTLDPKQAPSSLDADCVEQFALTPAELRATLRIQSKGTAERAQLAHAEAVTVIAVESYWAALGTRLRPLTAPGDRVKVAAVTRNAADRFGQAVARLAPQEAAFQLGSIYAALLPDGWRALHGVYYTPPALANRLLDQAEASGMDWKKGHVLDPAAGAGSFLVASAHRMQAALSGTDPAILVQNIGARLRGFELDPFAAWISQSLIEAQLLPLIEKCGRRLPSVLTVCDSLDCERVGEFDLVVGNPPFGRQKLTPMRRERFARSLFGHANLYGLFIDLATRLAKPGGLISFLTPSSFLAGEYFKNLRALMWREAPPASLDFVSPRKGVFEDVLQETVLATYRKGARRAPATASFLEPQSNEILQPQSAGQFSLPRKPTAPWFLARHSDEAALAKRLRAMRGRLVDWGYSVSTGPLVWNRHKDQLSEKRDAKCVPLVWAESVTSDGRFAFSAAKRNHKPFLRIEEGDNWLVVRRPCVLLQRTTAKEQARRLIAAEMPASFIGKRGVTVENHLNMLLPITEEPLIPPGVLAAFLNSTAADRAFRCISGSVAVSAYELENLPLPDPTVVLQKLKGQMDRQVVATVAGDLYGEGSDE